MCNWRALFSGSYWEKAGNRATPATGGRTVSKTGRADGFDRGELGTEAASKQPRRRFSTRSVALSGFPG
jgi:hypothetical protein